jgi:hypothetical protein
MPDIGGFGNHYSRTYSLQDCFARRLPGTGMGWGGGRRVATQHRVQGSAGQKSYPTSFLSTIFWCVNYVFIYYQRNPGFLWSMRCVLQRQDGPSGAEPRHRTGWGGTKMHGYIIIFGLQQKRVFICLPSAGQLHSTVFGT